MEGTTEPILAILGHPIAGNPSQFAIERALKEMDLDWRVLSFDVAESDVAAALDGFDVLGIRGVLVDVSVSRAASEWYRQRRNLNVDQMPAIDCLYRDQDGQLIGTCELEQWVGQIVDAVAKTEQVDSVADDETESAGTSDLIESGESTESELLWICVGESDAVAGSICALPHCQAIQGPLDTEHVAEANVIVLTEPTELEIEDWPSDDGSTVVIDLADGHPERARLSELGYRVVDEMERRDATLAACLLRWTGQLPQSETIRDAMEEYLGV